jgi:hypothetical protein
LRPPPLKSRPASRCWVSRPITARALERCLTTTR